MAERELTAEEAPDPSRSYERSRPEDEAGMGTLKGPKSRLSKTGDRMHHAVTNRQSSRQINAEDVVNASGGSAPAEGGRGAKKASPRHSENPPDSDAPKSTRLKIERKKI
jgi:hypothetical protein